MTAAEVVGLRPVRAGLRQQIVRAVRQLLGTTDRLTAGSVAAEAVGELGPGRARPTRSHLRESVVGAVGKVLGTAGCVATQPVGRPSVGRAGCIGEAVERI